MSNKKTWLLASLSAIGLAVIIVNKKKIMDTVLENVWDLVSQKRISTLHPSVKPIAIAFINEAARQGIKLRVTSSTRTFAEQNILYAKGRTTAGSIVTNAKGGESYHNFSLAIDVVEMINGVPQWNNSNWDKIGAIGKSFGFFWGGDFKSINDRPHFQMSANNTLAQLRTKLNTGDVTNGFVNLA